MKFCALILAAGQGTRMKSSLPKVLHRVLGRPMIGHAVQIARDLGAQQVIVIVGHGREQVEGYLRQHEPGDDLAFVVQSEQRGTAHAVAQARAALEGFDGKVLIMSGDVPGLQPATARAFLERGLQARTPLAFASCHVPDPTGYGRILRDAHGEVLRNIEHRDADDEQRRVTEINAGLYLADNAFLWAHLGRLDAANDQAEYLLPDLIALARAEGGVTDFVAPDHTELEGVNHRGQLAQADRVARQRRNEALMIAGVTMIDPATTYIDWAATVAPDVTLEPGVSLRGRTRVGAGCLIGQGAILEDTTLEEGVTILPYSHLESSIVRVGAHIGPFAHLRPACDIGPHAKIGNFVEAKKTKMGEGSKAGHLTYLGDATLGAHCNIGAGTITCNYDGQHKHPTTLGDGVFVGSNTALVAPITLEDGAYIGAGSTITQSVPAGALAVARGRQRNLEGWAARRRKPS
jgi:bifunctional UDP-N-acetylglucosamine pyrophosphorylase/glucosamine-1-phosphate N-acetyltransferase